MDKAIYLNRVRAHSKFLNQAMSVLGNGNIAKLIKATGLTFGVVTEKLPSGVLDVDLRIEQITDTSLFLNPGYAIVYDGSEIRIIEVPKATIDFSSQSDGIDYNIYMVPKGDSYEAGTLTFVNGSKTVLITGGDFAKTDPYESLVIDSSLLSNNGVYEVYQPSTTTLELVNIFTGTSESGLKWKIAGNFKGYKTATANDLIYSYDSYDIVISSQKSEEGLLLSTVRKSSGIIGIITDQRATNLFSMKALSKTVADEVIKGVTKDITTIEEKASAGTMDQVVSDSIQTGWLTGLSLSISGAILTIGSGVVYNSSGKRISIPSQITLDLQQYVTSGNIIETNTNYLYISYVSPNSYKFSWSQSGDLTEKGVILIGRIQWTDAGTEPFSIISSDKQPTKHKVNSALFSENQILTYQHGEMYFKDNVFWYRYLDETVRDPVLREIELIGLTRLNTLLKTALNGVAKSEKIRFSLYPTDEKDSWFFNNGIQSPVLIGYKHKITSWKIGILPAMSAPVSSSVVYDYTTKEVLIASKISSIITKTPNHVGDPNATVGVQFYGSGSVNKVRLVYNGVVIDETDMQAPDTDTLGQALINRLYQVELTVETTEDIITIIPPAEVE